MKISTDFHKKFLGHDEKQWWSVHELGRDHPRDPSSYLALLILINILKPFMIVEKSSWWISQVEFEEFPVKVVEWKV